jgi:hypothetical protein
MLRALAGLNDDGKLVGLVCNKNDHKAVRGCMCKLRTPRDPQKALKSRTTKDLLNKTVGLAVELAPVLDVSFLFHLF